MTEKDFTYQPVAVATEPTAPPSPSQDDQEVPSDTAVMVGCGLVGMVIGGPFLAILTALGGKWASGRQSPIGDSTRAVGRIAASAGKKAKEEHLWCKLKASLRSLFNRNNKCECESCNCSQSATAK
jgi:hypothetical protein|eukprot:g2852.t1 g2852   contig12:919522-919899(+)